MVPERFDPVLAQLAPLAERFAASGHRLYLVGGTVRDLMADMARDDFDLDLTTDARPPDIKAAVDGWADAVWTQGERFGTIGAKRHDRIYEITTFRAESYSDASRKPHVTYADEIEVDLGRRDFTVNAMALELTGGRTPTLVDPHGGADDLDRRMLRTPLGPDISFSDDPLRMLRAARFIARYGLQPTDGLVSAVERMGERMGIVSAERIRDELDKLITVDHPSRGLWFLHDTGLSDQFLPELSAMRRERDPLHRDDDVLAHTIAVIEHVRPRRARSADDHVDVRRVRLAALFHHVGTSRTDDPGAAGAARIARERMTALRYSNDDVDAVARLVALRATLLAADVGWTDPAVRRHVRAAGDLLRDVDELARCEAATWNDPEARARSERLDELAARIAALAETEDLTSIGPELDGRAVMEHLGLTPGREIGDALDFLLEVRLNEGPIGEEAARTRLDEWWAARSPSPPADG